MKHKWNLSSILFLSTLSSVLFLSRMMAKRRNLFYWLSQLSGWGVFVLGNILSASMQGEVSNSIYIHSLFIFLIGIVTTHFFRIVVKRRNWNHLKITALLPYIIISSVFMSLFFVVLNSISANLFLSGDKHLLFKGLFSVPFFLNVLNFSALFLLWSIIYFAVHIFKNWKREEITNLELKAYQTEIELDSFRAQMNPHFMFNSLNSIRALISENPESAKKAITALSGVLRSNLTLGRNETVELSEELDLVEKYLAIEKIRYEDRLMTSIRVDDEVLDFQIPPFILQTIVENGIKHGISKRIKGGKLDISARADGKDFLRITVANSGNYNPGNSEQAGVGLFNSRKRLQLIFGEDASLKIEPADDEVRVELVIPHKYKKKKNESSFSR